MSKLGPDKLNQVEVEKQCKDIGRDQNDKGRVYRF